MENRALKRGQIYKICKDLQYVTKCNKLVLFFLLLVLVVRDYTEKIWQTKK